MAKGDVRIIDNGGHNVVPTWTWQTEANATDIKAGEPVKLKSAGSPYVIPLANGEPIIGTTTQVIGIAASDSDHTASADGSVEVYLPLAGVVYACAATTAANVDTASELNALVGDRVAFDFSASTYTVDENQGDGATLGLQLVGGDADLQEMHFTLRPAAVEGPVA